MLGPPLRREVGKGCAVPVGVAYGFGLKDVVHCAVSLEHKNKAPGEGALIVLLDC